MKMYYCKATIQVDLAVEGESLAEAERIIDGVLSNAGDVIIFEGSCRDPDDELTGTARGHSRSRIQAEV